MVAQFAAETTNSEKVLYFLSLMSCLIKKLKYHMLFTSENFMFSDFTWTKTFLLQEMVVVVVGEGGMYIFVAINASKVVPNITRNFVHQYLSCKNNAETSCCRVGK